MNKINPLSFQEERELLRLAREGEKKEREQAIRSLLIHNENLVKYIANAYSFKKGNYDRKELEAEGMISLVKAIEKFDLNSKNAFATYAGYWIRQYIQSFIQKNYFLKQTYSKKKLTIIKDNLPEDILDRLEKETTIELLTVSELKKKIENKKKSQWGFTKLLAHPSSEKKLKVLENVLASASLYPTKKKGTLTEDIWNEAEKFQQSETGKKNVVYYDINYQNNDKENKSYSLADTLDDVDGSTISTEQIHHEEAKIQVSNLLNSLENREDILLARLGCRIKPYTLVDIYHLADQQEKKKMEKELKIKKGKVPAWDLEEKELKKNPIVKKYLKFFSRNYKDSELAKLTNKEESSIRQLKQKNFKFAKSFPEIFTKLKKIAEQRKLHFLI